MPCIVYSRVPSRVCAESGARGISGAAAALFEEARSLECRILARFAGAGDAGSRPERHNQPLALPLGDEEASRRLTASILGVPGLANAAASGTAGPIVEAADPATHESKLDRARLLPDQEPAISSPSIATRLSACVRLQRTVRHITG